jgi:hypothetical protein
MLHSKASTYVPIRFFCTYDKDLNKNGVICSINSNELRENPKYLKIVVNSIRKYLPNHVKMLGDMEGILKMWK